MSSKNNVILSALEQNDREQFITDNQRAFKFGATEEFGMRDDHFEEDGEIISRKTIEKSIDEKTAETYRIILDNKKIGGVVIKIDKEQKKGELVLLFVNPENHSKGVGYGAWLAVEEMHPEIEIWETVTPYFEKRNIHFYVNKCGFHIVEFYHKGHPDPNRPHNMENEKNSTKKKEGGEKDEEPEDEMFRFRKIIKK
jgi:N-acetylglutamate synthase-like GNAT family acetyltransferase